MLTQREIDKAKEVLKELESNCRSNGFQYEVNHGNMTQKEADKEIAIQMRFKQALSTALQVIDEWEKQKECFAKGVDIIGYTMELEAQLSKLQGISVEELGKIIQGVYKVEEIDEYGLADDDGYFKRCAQAIYNRIQEGR
jgi:hypothetical protein